MSLFGQKPLDILFLWEYYSIMKIPTRVHYGLQFMIELAAHHGSGPQYLKGIADSQDISGKYLSQIVISLKTARLVNGIRGSKGGYMLARSPNQINVQDIVDVLEGDLEITDDSKDPALCSKASHCVSQEVWRKLGRAMAETLSAITLDDLLKRRQEQMNVANYEI
jgi:Rrf2 family transcriptional regulator, cysteine metabolism repressor